MGYERVKHTQHLNYFISLLNVHSNAMKNDCFHCGLEGHQTSDCPKRDEPQTVEGKEVQKAFFRSRKVRRSLYISLLSFFSLLLTYLISIGMES